MGKGVDKIIIALIVVQWAYYARTVRGSALVERSKEYVEAATCLATVAQARIVFKPSAAECHAAADRRRHGAGGFSAIALEATLSFLGIGLPVTEPSLGLLISNGFEYMMSGKYWISIYPGIALLFTIVSINLVGDRLRDVLNPRLSR